MRPVEIIRHPEATIVFVGYTRWHISDTGIAVVRHRNGKDTIAVPPERIIRAANRYRRAYEVAS